MIKNIFKNVDRTRVAVSVLTRITRVERLAGVEVLGSQP